MAPIFPAQRTLKPPLKRPTPRGRSTCSLSFSAAPSKSIWPCRQKAKSSRRGLSPRKALALIRGFLLSRLLEIEPEDAGCVAAGERFERGLVHSAGPRDMADGVVFPHVKRIIRPHHNPVRPKDAQHIFKLMV